MYSQVLIIRIGRDCEIFELPYSKCSKSVIFGDTPKFAFGTIVWPDRHFRDIYIMSNINSDLIFLYAWKIYIKQKKELTVLFMARSGDNRLSADF